VRERERKGERDREREGGREEGGRERKEGLYFPKDIESVEKNPKGLFSDLEQSICSLTFLRVKDKKF